jgi:crotonobetainyl-CoA:carnitine CoA-transferase CaiB-like acyl-CoA transferase
VVSTSILNACLAASSGTFAFPDGSGPERPKLDRLQLGFNALYRLYETADGWICLAAVRPVDRERLADAIGKSDLPTDDDALATVLEAAFAERTAKEWFSILDDAGVPVEISAPGFVSSAADKPFLAFSATPAIVPGEAPELGVHTRAVLGEIGMTDDEIEAVCAESAEYAGAQ